MFASHLFAANLLPFKPDTLSMSGAGSYGNVPDGEPRYIVSAAYPAAWIVPMSWARLGVAPDNWLVVSGGIWVEGEWKVGGTQHNTVVSANAARAIDQKIDDGKPLTGSLRIVGYAYHDGTSACELLSPGFQGSCLGYGNSDGSQFNYGCVADNNPATTAYRNNDNIGDGAQLDPAAGGCKLAFKQSW